MLFSSEIFFKLCMMINLSHVSRVHTRSHDWWRFLKNKDNYFFFCLNASPLIFCCYFINQWIGDNAFNGVEGILCYWSNKSELASQWVKKNPSKPDRVAVFYDKVYCFLQRWLSVKWDKLHLQWWQNTGVAELTGVAFPFSLLKIAFLFSEQ